MLCIPLYLQAINSVDCKHLEGVRLEVKGRREDVPARCEASLLVRRARWRLLRQLINAWRFIPAVTIIMSYVLLIFLYTISVAQKPDTHYS